MKKLQFLLTLTFVGFISFTFLQAQDIAAINTHLVPKVAPAPVAKSPVFDLSLGKQSAFFENLDAYVANHLIYPETAKENSIEGTVSALVEISAEGKITAAKVIDSLGFGCDEAALKLLADMPAWTAAANYGLPVKSKKLLQFNFKLR